MGGGNNAPEGGWDAAIGKDARNNSNVFSARVADEVELALVLMHRGL